MFSVGDRRRNRRQTLEFMLPAGDILHIRVDRRANLQLITQTKRVLLFVSSASHDAPEQLKRRVSAIAAADKVLTHLVVQDVILRVLIFALLHLCVIIIVKPIAAERVRRSPSVPHLIMTCFLSAFETPLFKLFPEERLARVLLHRSWAGKVPVLVLPVASRSSGNRGVGAKIRAKRRRRRRL